MFISTSFFLTNEVLFDQQREIVQDYTKKYIVFLQHIDNMCMDSQDSI